jgi:hypothetical protein
MTLDQLKTLLRAWGRLYSERVPVDFDEENVPMLGGVSHPLARGMQFAPGKNQKVVNKLNLERGGYARRRLMARAAQIGGFNIVPAAFVDPVRCVETRVSFYGHHAKPVPEQIQRVQRAALELAVIDPMRGMCLRVTYCMQGSYADKAEIVSGKIGRPIGVRVLREAVAFSEGWMHGRLSA